MTLFQKLLMLKELVFLDGEIQMLRQRIFIGPTELMLALTDVGFRSPAGPSSTYKAVRDSFTKGWADNVRRVFGFTATDYFRALIDISNFGGWGKSELLQLDEKTVRGTFRIQNALVATALKGKATEPVDHAWRGLAAGGLTQAFERDIDWIETKCYALGHPQCEFTFGPREDFRESKDPSVRRQLPAEVFR